MQMSLLIPFSVSICFAVADDGGDSARASSPNMKCHRRFETSRSLVSAQRITLEVTVDAHRDPQQSSSRMSMHTSKAHLLFHLRPKIELKHNTFTRRQSLN